MEIAKQGFTLIEVIIVLVVIAILASIAIPLYTNQIVKTRRSDGQIALLDLATRMERYYAESHSYATATIASGNATTDVLTTAQSPQGYYTLSIVSQSAHTFVIQAAPNGAQATADRKCADLRVDQLGQKSVTGTGTVADCW